MNKHNYETPEIIVIEFAVEDIITTSQESTVTDSGEDYTYPILPWN